MEKNYNTNNVITNATNDIVAYPEIKRINGRITCQSVKDFLYNNGFMTAENYNNPDCDYYYIAAGIIAAFRAGKLSLNCTKQCGIVNHTPIRMSTNLGGKMKNVWAFSTLSLCNPFCLARMKKAELVCSHCYVKKSLHIDAILNYCQNFYVLTAGLLPAAWIPVINPKNAERHPIIRLEAMGDLANYEQACNYLTIANNNPVFRFALWTKNPRILVQAIDDMEKPSNLSTVLSMSRVNKFDDNDGRYMAYFDHRFIVVDNTQLRDQLLINARAYQCQCGPNSCIHCQKCYHKDQDYITAVEMLRK